MGAKYSEKGEYFYKSEIDSHHTCNYTEVSQTLFSSIFTKVKLEINHTCNYSKVTETLFSSIFTKVKQDHHTCTCNYTKVNMKFAQANIRSLNTSFNTLEVIIYAQRMNLKLYAYWKYGTIAH